MKQILASDVIEIDDKFIASIKEKLKEDNDNGQVEKYFTVDQVADYTRQSAQTVRRHITNNQLSAIKMGKNWLISEENYKTYTSKSND